MAEPAQCIRCHEAAAADPDGYCGHCHWAVRSEIENGLYRLRVYLKAQAGFAAWLLEHGQQP